MKKKAADRIEFYTCPVCTEDTGNSDLNEEIAIEETGLNQPFVKVMQVTLLEDKEFSPIMQFLPEEQLPSDEKLAKQIQNVAKFYSYENGLLCKSTKSNKRVMLILKKLRNAVFHQMHGIPLAGHLGIRKTISKIETAGFGEKRRL